MQLDFETTTLDLSKVLGFYFLYLLLLMMSFPFYLFLFWGGGGYTLVISDHGYNTSAPKMEFGGGHLTITC